MARGTVYNRIFNEEDWLQVNQDNKNIMEDFLEEYKQQKKKQSTIDQYKNDIRIVLIYVLKQLKNKCVLELTKKDFRRFNLWLQEKGMSASRVNRMMSAVRSMLTFCEDDDDYEYDVNVALKVKGLPKEDVREIYFLTDEQVVLIREELRSREEYIKMLLLDLAYDSGGRRNELYQVKKEGLLEKNNTNIVIGKRGKKFPLLYFSRTKESLKLYLEQRGEDDIESLWVVGKKEKRMVSYQTIYEWFVYMSEILKELTGEDIPFNAHSLRHSLINNLHDGTHYILTELGRDKIELNELKLLVNHSNISTTESYLRDNSNDLLESTFGIKITNKD